LALAFALQDQADFVQRAKTSLANPVVDNETDDDTPYRYDNVTRSASTLETSAIATRGEDGSSDSAKRRNAWEDALDEVFGEEVFAEELETV